jgi:hypothetical protein
MVTRNPSLQSIHTKARREIRNSLFIQLHAAQMVMTIAKKCGPLDERQSRCVRSVRRILEATEARLWHTSLEPPDILTISAEVERLWFQIDALT